MKYILKNKEIELSEEEVKEIVKQNSTPVEEKVVGIAIRNRFTGSIIFQSAKTNFKEAVGEAKNSRADLSGADLSGANLRGADLSGADLSGAEMQNVKFYGRGGRMPLKRSQLPSFLGALGFVIEE